MLERDDITRALRATNGNVGKAAKLLGASRRTLQSRMRFYGIPKGQAGRRKRTLSYKARPSKKFMVGLGAVAAVVGGVALYQKRGSTA